MGEKRKIHYAWLVLAGCCILQGATLGLVSNCVGVFYSPVCEDLGFEMGGFTFYRTLYCISSALVLPMVAKCLRSYDTRWVISLAVLIFGGCSILMGTFHHLWQWYVTGIVQGAASSFVCMLPAPIILGNWFRKKTGTAVGISSAFSGLMGMMGSFGLGRTIPAFGWRASYMGIGLICILLVLPVAIFLMRYQPSDLGLLPYGADPDSEPAITASAEDGENGEKFSLKRLLRQPEFYISALAYWVTAASAYLNPFLTSCGLSAGLILQTAALMATMSQLGNMVSKLILGKTSDKLGVIRAFLLATGLAFFGHALLFIGSVHTVMAGALFYGLTLPLSSVMMPLFCRLFWKGESYSSSYAYASMVGTLFGAPFNMLFGALYDITGTYRVTIGVSGGLLIFLFLLILLEAVRLKRSSLQNSPSKGR